MAEISMGPRGASRKRSARAKWPCFSESKRTEAETTSTSGRSGPPRRQVSTAAKSSRARRPSPSEQRFERVHREGPVLPLAEQLQRLHELGGGLEAPALVREERAARELHRVG